MPKLKEDIQRLREENARLNKNTSKLQEKINTKTLNMLKGEKAELERKNEEDRRIINDENASPSDKEAAEGRVAQREEEIKQFDTQIEEIEPEKPLRERVKEILKRIRRYGFLCSSCCWCNDWGCYYLHYQLAEGHWQSAGKRVERD